MADTNGSSASAEEKQVFKSLAVESIKYRTLLTKKYKERKPYQKNDERIIDAFIPGSILKLYVKKGDKVQEGQKLLVLEAMKMRNDLLSPIDGKVKKVLVNEGDVVKKATVLIELE